VAALKLKHAFCLFLGVPVIAETVVFSVNVSWK